MFRLLISSTLLLLLVSCGGSGHSKIKPAQTMNGWWEGVATSTNGTESLRIGFILADTDTSYWRVSNVLVSNSHNCYQSSPYLEIKPDGPISAGMKIRIDLWPDSTKMGRHLESYVSLLNNDTNIISGSFSITNSSAPCIDSTGVLTLLNSGNY